MRVADVVHVPARAEGVTVDDCQGCWELGAEVCSACTWRLLMLAEAEQMDRLVRSGPDPYRSCDPGLDGHF